MRWCQGNSTFFFGFVLCFQSITCLRCLVFLYTWCFHSALVGDNFWLCWFEFWHLRASSFWSLWNVTHVFGAKSLPFPSLIKPQLMVPKMSVWSNCVSDRKVIRSAWTLLQQKGRTVNAVMGILILKTSKTAKICFELFSKNVTFLFPLTFITIINHKSFYILKTSDFTYYVWKYNKMTFYKT